MSVPYADVVKLAIGEKERRVVARAGVSGQAWVSVWLPALLEGTAERAAAGGAGDPLRASSSA